MLCDMRFCEYLQEQIDSGMCYDLQMIALNYINTSALPDIEIDRQKLLNCCNHCPCSDFINPTSMTLYEARALLQSHGIIFSEIQFDDVADFRKFKDPSGTSERNDCPSPVTLLVIASNNKRKNLELQFADKNNDSNFVLIDLNFGGYCFDILDCNKDLPQAVVNTIKDITSNNMAVIAAKNLSKNVFTFFHLVENDGVGLSAFEKALQHLNTKESFFKKLFRSKIQYEIYDWNNYQCIIK